jgi:hypothetical protein
MINGLSPLGKTVALGIYRHYKGQLYEVIGVGHHTETEEELVFYRSLYGNTHLWVRPLNQFCETVEVDGKMRPRFELERSHG